MPAETTLKPVNIALTAVVTAVWTALPDYVERGRPLTLARGVVMAGVLGFVTWKGVRMSRTTDDEPVGAFEQEPAPPSARTVALVLAGGVSLSVLSWQARRRLSIALVERLQARGVRRPWTVVAVGGGLLSVGGSVARARFFRSKRWPPAVLRRPLSRP